MAVEVALAEAAVAGLVVVLGATVVTVAASVGVGLDAERSTNHSYRRRLGNLSNSRNGMVCSERAVGDSTRLRLLQTFGCSSPE